jgi:DNA-binding Lrp family transcriptional regulator
MKRPFLDRTDVKIINLLAKDSRMSYRAIGSLVGMTSKSVRARIDNMISNAILEKFIVKVNPGTFGYTTDCLLIVKYSKLPEDIINRLNLLGDLSCYVKCIGGISIFSFIVKQGSEDKVELLIDSLRPAEVRTLFVNKSYTHKDPSDSDLKLIKSMISDPRKKISDIARELSMSPKTVSRRLEKLKENKVLQFSVLCNPSTSAGYIQFAIVMHIEKPIYYRHFILERIYRELQENILFELPVIDPSDVITFVLWSQDIYSTDRIIRKIESFDGVKGTDLFILDRLEHFNKWIVREIDKRLLPIKSKNILPITTT